MSSLLVLLLIGLGGATAATPSIVCPTAELATPFQVSIPPDVGFFDDDDSSQNDPFRTVAFGSSSSISVGDINGDGIPDIVSLAPNADGGNGIVLVQFGGIRSIQAPFTISGDTIGCRITSAAAIGDFNGDGVGDVAIGCGRGPATGYVVYGNPAAPNGAQRDDVVLSIYATKREVFTMTFDGADVQATVSVAGGDVNNDTLADVILGVPSYGPQGEPSWGRVYVIHGMKDPDRARAPMYSTSYFVGAQGFAIDGVPGPNHRLGANVAYLGDVNGDGVGDLAATSWSLRGDAVHVVYGRAAGTSTDPLYVFTNGEAALVPPPPPTHNTVNIATIPRTGGFDIITPVGLGMRPGPPMSAAGDFDGDGVGDIAVSFGNVGDGWPR
jgi:hypothetical protein